MESMVKKKKNGLATCAPDQGTSSQSEGHSNKMLMANLASQYAYGIPGICIYYYLYLYKATFYTA